MIPHEFCRRRDSLLSAIKPKKGAEAEVAEDHSLYGASEVRTRAGNHALLNMAQNSTLRYAIARQPQVNLLDFGGYH